MKYLVFILIAIFVASCELQESEYFTAFRDFNRKYKKMFASQSEFEKRFNIFKKNLEKAKKINELSGSQSLGVSPFMDLSENEFASRFLSKIKPSEGFGKIKKTLNEKEINYYKKLSDDIPKNWTWVDNGAVTRVKNQGSCGSCWAFSTIGNIEGQWALAGNKLQTFSEQQLVDCDHTCDPEEKESCDSGCQGGLMMNAFKYVIDNGGVSTEESYPYQGFDAQCQKKPLVAKIRDSKLLSEDEDVIKAYLYKNGPIAVALNANLLQFYIGDIFNPYFCDSAALDHGVLLVGYGVGKHLITRKDEPYWIVKNSWGSSWGLKGYFKIIRGTSKCGINKYACTSIV